MSLFGKRNDKTEHRHVQDRLSAYLDGELSSRERTAVEGHLQQCQHCQWDLDTLRQTVEWVRELPPVSVPRVFTIPVPARPARASGWRWSVPLLQGATALVALLFFFVVAGDFMLTAVQPAMQATMPLQQEVALEWAPTESRDEDAHRQLEIIAEEPVEVAEEAEVAGEAVPEFAAAPAAEPLSSPEEPLALEMEAGVSDSELGAAEMEMPAPAAEEAAGDAIAKEKSVAASPPAAATTPVETQAARTAPTGGATATSLPTAPPTAPPTATTPPTRPAPTMAPTLVAAAQNLDGQQRLETDPAPSQPSFRWLGLAEVILGAALVALVISTAVAMISRRRAG